MIGRFLTLSCASCHGHVLLTYGGEGLYRWQPWICPHCLVRNGMHLAGLILNIKKPLYES